MIEIESRCFGQEDLEIYADLTADHNPLHLDAEFAARTSFGRPIVYGTLVIAPLWQAIEARFGAEALSSANIEVKFLKPVEIGAWLHYEGGRARETGETTDYEFTVRSESLGQIVAQVTVCLMKAPP